MLKGEKVMPTLAERWEEKGYEKGIWRINRTL
jgi:hypothetical protein